MKLKILLLNLGYCLGLNGSFFNYIRYFYRYLFCPAGIQKKAIAQLQKIIQSEKPDLCCLLEIHPDQLQFLINEEYDHFSVTNKYWRKSPLVRFPFTSQNCNAFLSRKQVSFKKHYLKHGLKKLVYEIRIGNNIYIFVGHFAFLSAQTRQKQFSEIKRLVKNKQHIILCGDFNIFKGNRELEPLLKNGDLKIINKTTDKTFPAYRPKHSIDLFLCSKNINVTRFEVLGVKLSDHLPVILEAEI